jgi:glutathione S-transferase
MRLYESGRAPNPRRVRIFLAEKGVTLPAEQIDLAALEHRSPGFTALNPLQRVPVLVLDDGTAIAESMAICRYFEALRPEPPLFGRGAKEEALVEMWNRRAELNLLAGVAAVFRHLHPAMKEMEKPQIPEWAEANRPRVIDFLRLVDDDLKDRLYLAGDHYSVADITALVAVDFMRPARIELPADLVNVRRWHAQVSARPSAKA